MKKIVLRILLVLGIVVLILFGGFQYMKNQTKKASPEATVETTIGAANIELTYSRPSVKGRTIFGDLVPYGQVWRTGANEATTFSTSADLSINGETLPAGDYTLWTIPGQSEWKVIWNSKDYGWGVNWDSEPSREAEFDALTVTVPAEAPASPVEMFTISFTADAMIIEWADARVVVPISA